MAETAFDILEKVCESIEGTLEHKEINVAGEN